MIRLSTRRIIGACALGSVSLLSGCTRDWRSRPLSMWNQSRYKPLEADEFFNNGSSAQPVVAGTVARGQLRINDALYTGRTGGNLVTKFPFTMAAKDIARGQERFNVYCSPCHGKSGYSYDQPGMIVQRGFAVPPDYRIARLRNAPVGHFYDVMTNGYGAMYSYASRVPVEDRWRIAAYIRVLQRSSNDTPNERPRSPAINGPAGVGANNPNIARDMQPVAVSTTPGTATGTGGATAANDVTANAATSNAATANAVTPTGTNAPAATAPVTVAPATTGTPTRRPARITRP